MNTNSDKPFEPPYPKPLTSKNKPSLWKLFKLGRKSSLHVLFEGDYKKDVSITKISGYKIFTPKDNGLIKDILKSNYKDFPKHRYMDDILRPLLGDSIFNTNGKTWERQRRIMDIGFEKAGLKNVFSLMCDAVQQMHQRLDSYKDGQAIDIDVEMTHVTADIIMRTILSSPIESDRAFKVFHYFEEYQEKSNSLLMLRLFRLPKWVSLRSYIIWKRRGRQIRNFIGEIIKERHKEFIEKNGETNYGDILEALMDTEDPETKTKFNTKELIDQIVMLFLAGHETSASALSWALYILSNQPEHTEALAAEAQNIFGQNQLPTFRETSKLKKARDIFKETLRLYPPVTQLSREATGKCPVAGHTVAPGTTVNINPWLIHRREKVWENAHAFCPERFSNGESKKNSGSYLPFSQGPRICIGAGFALQEALLILSSITKKYRIKPVSEHTPDPIARLTLRSLNGIKIALVRRDSGIPQEKLFKSAPNETSNSNEECPFNK